MRLLPDKIFDEKQVIALDKTRTKIARRQTANFYKLFPFTTSQSDSIKGALNEWENEFGTFARRIAQQELATKSFNTEHVMESLLDQTETNPGNEDEVHAFYTDLIVKSNGGLNVTHPSMYKYIQGNSATKRKLGTYLADLTYQALDANELDEVRAIFETTEHETLLDKMIVRLLPKLKDRKFEKEYALQSAQPMKLLSEDLTYLSKHPQYFLKEANSLMKYYLHFVVSQTTIKINGFEMSKWDHPTNLFYTLSPETTVTSRRKTINSGMSLLASASENLFAHELTLAQLSCNTCNETLNDSKSRIMTYDELFNQFNELTSEAQNQFLEDVDAQSMRILQYSGLNQDLKKSETFNEAVKQLFSTMKMTTPEAAQKRYGDQVKNIANSQFTKRRGRLGYVLSLNQEMLILLSAVSCKEDRITFVELLDRLRQRGVNFDNESATAFLLMLEKINVIDKKSDSGEAQYVKPIL